MPFREVKGSVLLGNYDTIVLETKIIREEHSKFMVAKLLNKVKQYAHEHYLATGLTNAVQTLPYWESAQEYICEKLNTRIPANDILVSPAPDPSSPQILHLFKGDWQRETIQDIQKIYSDIITAAEEIGARNIAIPVIGKKEGKATGEDNLIAEDFFVNYFMKTNSEMRIDLFVNDMYSNFGLIGLPSTADNNLTVLSSAPINYINSVVELLNDDSRLIFRSFPTMEKLDLIFYDYNSSLNGKTKQILDSGVLFVYYATNETLKKYEHAAKKLENESSTVPRSSAASSTRSTPKTPKQALSKNESQIDDLPPESYAMNKANEYAIKLEKAITQSGKSKNEFYHDKLKEYIFKSDLSENELASEIGVSYDSIYKIKKDITQFFKDSRRPIALAASLKLQGYDFYVCAVSGSRRHDFPSTPREKMVWRFILSGMTGIKALENSLKQISSDFSLYHSNDKSDSL